MKNIFAKAAFGGGAGRSLRRCCQAALCMLALLVSAQVVIAQPAAPGNEEALRKLDQQIATLRSALSVSDSTESGKSTAALAIALMRRAELIEQGGYFNLAAKDLNAAKVLANEVNSPALMSMIIGAQGELYHRARDVKSFNIEKQDPTGLLEDSLELAQAARSDELIAASLLRLGNWQLSESKIEESYDNLSKAVDYADRTNSALLKLNSRVSRARAIRQFVGERESLDEYKKILELIGNDLPAEQRATLLLQIGREAKAISGNNSESLAENAFRRVTSLESAGISQRTLAAAYGELGELQLLRSPTQAGANDLLRAIGLAPDAHDLAYEWERDLAGYLRTQDLPDQAIDAYRRALRHVESIRLDIPVTYTEGRSSFQTEIAPIFLDLADMLMLKADPIQETEEGQGLLREAQLIMEQLKGSELQDYYRGACVIEQSSAIGQIPTGDVAVVYPVVFRERLAILLSIDNRYQHFSVTVPAQTLASTVEQYSDFLRNPNSRRAHRPVSRQIHDWLIGPLQESLQQNDIKTLFYVPDGVLRTVPISGLWSGEGYLIQGYDIATAPGLTLWNSEQLADTSRNTLVAGLSRPGDAIKKLPRDFYTELLTEVDDNTRGFRLLNTPSRDMPRSDSLRSDTPRSDDDTVRDVLELPSVEIEVESLSQKNPQSTVLLNEEFSIMSFSDEVRQSPYRVVHVASHGYFGGQADDSWLMTHDDLLRLGQLSDLFSSKRFSDEPVELLILSACETAAGNDLAPLGLSGVALASGARSVLGSLWVVADDATRQLMEGFYDGLNVPGASKATALREAQIKILTGGEFEHPYFWAPFILVGNWL